MEKTLLAQGRTAEVYEWENSRVLKLYRQDMPKEAIENEYKISLEVQRQGIPSPKVFDMITIDDRLGVVYERVLGNNLLKTIIKAPWLAARGARKMAELQYKVHKCEVSNLPSIKDILRRNIKKVDLLTEEKKKKILSYLDKLPEGSKLCHGDFHPDNILISQNKEYIIDWMTGCMGSPEADVARTSILLRIGSMPPGTSKVVIKLVDFARKKLYKGYIEQYIKLSGMNMESIIAWEMPLAAARLIEWLPLEEKHKLLDIVDGYLNRIS